MKLTIEIPDETEDAVRQAFSVQNKPATDEQLAEAIIDMVATRTTRVHESTAIAEAKQASDDLRRRILPAERTR